MMATLIRAELSEKNKYWISKHRHYELKHFCLQYPIWKKEYYILENSGLSLSSIEWISSTNIPGNPTERKAILKTYYKERMNLLEAVAIETDRYLAEYILKAVTEELSYICLKTKYGMPCGRDMYYDRYRRFFWLLNKARK